MTLWAARELESPGDDATLYECPTCNRTLRGDGDWATVNDVQVCEWCALDGTAARQLTRCEVCGDLPAVCQCHEDILADCRAECSRAVVLAGLEESLAATIGELRRGR